MAVNDKIGNDTRKQSINEILNQSFDQEFQQLMSELIGYDPLANSGSGALKRITTNALGEYATNDVDDVSEANIAYIGKEDPAGDWYIEKVDTSSGTSVRYATINNNSSYTTYSTAWTDRASLTYDTYGTAF